MLLGDSTLDNGRYLNQAIGELSVEKQLAKRCADKGWEMTVLAQDGSMLEDVLMRQVPLVPEKATHVVLSASGNDLLSLLNQMVMANFTATSMYSAIGDGLYQVSERYRGLLVALKGLGCHFACCTVYRPNFNHFFFKSLAVLSLGLHNSRIQQIAQDLDCSVIDLASMFDSREDFANPLELSTRGGSKLVSNIVAFVHDHPLMTLQRYRNNLASIEAAEDDEFLPVVGFLGMPTRCCATRSLKRRVYANKECAQDLEEPDGSWPHGELGRPLEFSEAQERWRHT